MSARSLLSLKSNIWPPLVLLAAQIFDFKCIIADRLKHLPAIRQTLSFPVESISALAERSPQARRTSELPTGKLTAISKEVLLTQTRALPQRPACPYHARIAPEWLPCLIIMNAWHRAFGAADLFRLVKAQGLERWWFRCGFNLCCLRSSRQWKCPEQWHP